MEKLIVKTAPTTTVSETTKVTCLNTGISPTGTSSPLGRYATGYVAGKSALNPIPQPARDANFNLTQNSRY